MATAVRSSPQAAPAFPPGSHLLSGPRHGPLPPLLLLLTAVTGLVDAVSILRLGRVFVANMTGNLRARSHGPALLRRVLAVATRLAGGAGQGLAVLRIGPAAALGLATALLALVTAGAMVSARRPGTWRAGTP